MIIILFVLLLVLVYLFIGWLAIIINSICHLIRAIELGYEVFEYWNTHNPKDVLAQYYGQENLIKGLFKWPIKIFMIDDVFNKFYELYDQYQEHEIES